MTAATDLITKLRELREYIALAFEISPAHVRKLVNRKAWRHL